MALPLHYNVRNVRVRWQLTLLAIGGIALVVAVFAVLMSMSEGFSAALRSTGRPDNAIVVQRGSSSELTSGVPLEDRNMIVVDDRVARDASGQPLASWELVVVLALPRASDGEPANVTLRAVTPRAFEVRGGIRVVEGRSFTPGLDEVIVGKKLLSRIKGLEIGGNVKYQQKLFKIVGLFGGNLHETALELLDEGADLLDLGAESTRPGTRVGQNSAAVSADQEQARLLPVIEGILKSRPDAIISVDTYKAVTARAALQPKLRWPGADLGQFQLRLRLCLLGESGDRRALAGVSRGATGAAGEGRKLACTDCIRLGSEATFRRKTVASSLSGLVTRRACGGN